MKTLIIAIAFIAICIISSCKKCATCHVIYKNNTETQGKSCAGDVAYEAYYHNTYTGNDIAVIGCE